MKTRKEHFEFIQLNRIALASCAWNGFVANGRGLVCVLCDQHDEDKGLVPFNFMEEKKISQLLRPWYGTNEARMVSAYDPKIEVVICFCRSENDRMDFDCYRFKPDLAPPEAAQRE